MKQWNGLLRKEWVQWRLPVLVLAILMVSGLFILPSFAVFVVNLTSVFEVTMVVCFVAAAFGSLEHMLSMECCGLCFRRNTDEHG